MTTVMFESIFLLLTGLVCGSVALALLIEKVDKLLLRAN
jgi:hypothetical protein